jgi:hypothetical protein
VLAGGAGMAIVSAEDGVKTLPTLLIKGEVVALDAADPAATLLKIKDRYGFETPIYLTPQTKVAQGEAAAEISAVTTGASVEVEYNFDVNTAKRHAVSVKLPGAAAAIPALEAAVEAVPAEGAAVEAAPDAAEAMDAAVEAVTEDVAPPAESEPAAQP